MGVYPDAGRPDVENDMRLAVQKSIIVNLPEGPLLKITSLDKNSGIGHTILVP